MAMNPIETIEKIENDYISYLQEILTVRDPEINKKAKVALSNASFVKGPFLEATLPFLPGKSLHELSDEGIISFEFSKIAKDVHYDRNLYLHQEKAIRKISEENKNIIVATGTGSGKTECYLYPIFNYLMREKERGLLDSGVRALLLFPMNALANDQVKKLRGLLKNYPEITFGRYTGETSSTLTEEEARRQYASEHGDDPLPNEMLTRKRMQETPPHILLTNYAMLEYLLLRPADSELFDGMRAKSWKYIVIDEAHTYKGATGSEIAFLLRRLKERIRKNSAKQLQCIATSATLGDENAKDTLAQFATNIFSEKFYGEDIITAARIERTAKEEMYEFTLDRYKELKANVSKMKEEETERYLYEALLKDIRLIKIQRVLKKKPTDIKEIADYVFSDLDTGKERLDGIILLVELAAKAKPNANSNALLPARYHFFVKSLEGLFASLYPSKQVYLDRKASINIGNQRIKVFELGNCQACNQEYIIGRIDLNKKLELPLEHEEKEYFLIEKGRSNLTLDFDEDDDNESLAAISGLEKNRLCTVCGMIYPADEKHSPCCNVQSESKVITVYRLSQKGKHNEINGCPVCGAMKKSLLKGFYTSNHAATFTIANSLYDALPSSGESASQMDSIATETDDLDFGFDDEEAVKTDATVKDESGRKLLIFSDNRQEAAFFAGYLSGKHDQIMWRRLLLMELEKYPDGVYVHDLMRQIAVSAEKKGLYGNYSMLSEVEKMNIAAKYILKEYMETEKMNGLAGRGLIEIYPEETKKKPSLWGASPEDSWNILRFLMDTLRTAGAVQFPDNLSYTDEFFEPRNYEIGFNHSAGSLGVKSFLPATGRKNKRSEFLQKIQESLSLPDSNIILEKVYKILTEKFEKNGYFVSKTRTGFEKEGIVHAINYNKWKIRRVNPQDDIYVCNKCGKVSYYSIGGKCQQFKCDGEYRKIKAREFQEVPYYKDLYSDNRIIPMVAKEHTAQLSKAAAGKYQEDFEKGKINVLSCSTTFEMGVDVGELEATFLRNVPPETANYIQRAGRAGRRTSSAAFAVTFARRNSHDLNFFNRPEEIISGKIKAPYIETNNDKIASRHINSVVFAWFFNKHPEYFGDVKRLVGINSEDGALTILIEQLEERPPELLDALHFILGDYLSSKMGVDSWSFVDKLVGSEGSFSLAIEKRKAELQQLDEIQLMYSKLRKFSAAENVKKLYNTYAQERCINFLASTGVLPKYGFPVDVVDMTITSNSIEAKSIELSRDLKMAISEFAPPTSIVANGRVWRSYALNTVPKKGWPEQHYYECPKCHRIAPAEESYMGIEEEDITGSGKDCICGEQMNRRKFITPIFGFSTSWDDKPKLVGDEKPKKYYSTRTQFWGIDKLDSHQEQQRIEKNVIINEKEIPIVYTPNGKLTVINRGRTGQGLFICKVCGYVDEVSPQKKHKNKYGKECINTNLSRLSLGHSFNSDILKIELPHHPHAKYSFEQQWYSLLYALLEGASCFLDIDRNDINGCLNYENGNTSIILYDESAGGAGNVKRIAINLEKVLLEAKERVSGICGCSEDTSCYGCLRNYGNQFEHEKLIRGAAFEYLSWLIN